MAALKDLFKNPSPAELDLTERYTRLKHSGARERNFEAFAATGLPHKRVETWKYSDLRERLGAIPDAISGTLPHDPFAPLNATTLRFNSAGFERPSARPNGIEFIERAEPQPMVGAEDLPVAALGSALSNAPGVLMVDVTKTPDAPLHLVFETDGPLGFSHIIFAVRKGVELTVYESHLAAGGFSSRVLEYSVEAGATLNRTVYQSADPSAVQVMTALIHLNSGAKLIQSGLGFGAKLCRNETQVVHLGPNAHAEANSGYLVAAGHHYDQTSLFRHSVADCVTRQLAKGAVMDEGQAIFQGKFFVARDAQHTDAEMAHNALILENGGEVNAKPELEIYADDVECAHGNTVGALDEDALFYIRQRGVPEQAARALLTEAFVIETLENVPEDAQELLIAEARTWLEAQL